MTAAPTLIADGLEADRAGRRADAAARFAEAAEVAARAGDAAACAEALRRLGVTHHQRGDDGEARACCARSVAVAQGAGLPLLAAEALNCLGAFDLEAGDYTSAQYRFRDALGLAEGTPRLRARIAQNLGVLANIRGELHEADAHYRDALAAFTAAGDRHGEAQVFHNLGMISADRQRWGDAEAWFDRSRELAEALGDVPLRGLCLLNHTEVLIARQQYGDARRSAEAALQVFDGLGSVDGKSAAYRFLGVLYRETGEPALAEARLRQSIELARDGVYPLEEAETLRELALLLMATGRNPEALRALEHAQRLFTRLEASLDLHDVASRGARLEATYLEVVRRWGESIESADRYTFGHCERVARYAVAVAEALGLDRIERTTIEVGAYLHDVGKVRVPHEVLNKPGRLTAEETQLMQLHPVYGVEMLASIEFPWDIRPIIRWHHERADGRGYPDGLQGEEIPVHAQLIGIVDVWDALTTDRSYRKAMPRDVALAEMVKCRAWWRPEIFAAFERAIVAG